MIRAATIVLCLTLAFVAATCKVASAQGATNPLAIDFESPDHTQVNFYDVCFYPSATATTPTRCNRVPVTQVTGPSSTGLYRIPRAAWQTGLPFDTELFPKVRTVHGEERLGAEVAPTVAPFSFSLRVRPVTRVTLVPSTP